MNAATHRVLALRLSYDNAEALKWIAFACMLVDHANKLFADGAWQWAVPIGRVAFPLFAFTIARHLGDWSSSRRLLRRLVLVGLVATPGYLVTLGAGHLVPPNILFTFAIAIAIWHLARIDKWPVAVAVFLVAGIFVDYAWAGLALVLACGVWWRWPGQLAGWGVALALGGLCWFNGNTWACLAVLVVQLAVMFDWRVLRIRNFFWIAYPAHLVILAMLVSWGVGAAPLR